MTTREESYTTINANEFNRLWAEANKVTQDMRAIIDDMLLNQRNSRKDVLASKEELILDEKTGFTAKQAILVYEEFDTQKVNGRIFTFAKAIHKIIAKKYITN